MAVIYETIVPIRLEGAVALKEPEAFQAGV